MYVLDFFLFHNPVMIIYICIQRGKDPFTSFVEKQSKCKAVSYTKCSTAKKKFVSLLPKDIVY